MQGVQLDAEEWQKVMAIIAGAPWNIANPLLMKIGDQLRRQQEGNSGDEQAFKDALTRGGAHGTPS